MSGSFKCDGTNNSCGRTYSLSNGQKLNWDVWVDKPFFPSYANIQPAKAAYKDVLSDVGMIMPFFDDHDKRIIQETLDGTSKYKGSITGKLGLPDRESDVGGYEDYPKETRPADFDSDGDGIPNWWETVMNMNTANAKGDFSESNADRDNDNYTNLEEYLHWMATPHVSAAVGKTVTVKMSELTRGYTKSPVWKAGTSPYATLAVNGDILSITPTTGCGVTYIDFTVTDGDSKTRTIGLYVEGSVSGAHNAPDLRKIGSPQWRTSMNRTALFSTSFVSTTMFSSFSPDALCTTYMKSGL